MSLKFQQFLKDNCSFVDGVLAAQAECCVINSGREYFKECIEGTKYKDFVLIGLQGFCRRSKIGFQFSEAQS